MFSLFSNRRDGRQAGVLYVDEMLVSFEAKEGCSDFEYGDTGHVPRQAPSKKLGELAQAPQ
jgi:hypothetical protein